MAAASKSPSFDSPFEFGLERANATDGAEVFGAVTGVVVEMIPDSSIGLLGMGGATATTGGVEPFNFVTSLFTLSLKEST